MYASTGAILGYFVSSAGSGHAVPSATNSAQLVDAILLIAFCITRASWNLEFECDTDPWPNLCPYCERSVSTAFTLAARAAGTAEAITAAASSTTADAANAS